MIMSLKNKRRLRNFLIDRHVQLRIIAYGLIYVLSVAVVTVAVLLFPVVREMNWSDSMEVRYWAAQTFILIVTKVSPAVVFIALLYIFHLTMVTHRVCGPLVNFRRVLRRIGTGDLTPRVAMRRGDYLQEEIREINDMTDRLRSFVKDIKGLHARLSPHIDRLRANGEDSETVELVIRHIEEMERVLARFKVD